MLTACETTIVADSGRCTCVALPGSAATWPGGGTAQVAVLTNDMQSVFMVMHIICQRFVGSSTSCAGVFEMYGIAR